MLQIKNTLGGGKPEGLYAWTKNEIGSELKEINKSISTLPYEFYQGSAVMLNGEIHILGSSSGGNETKHYKWDGTSWTSVSTLPYNYFYRGSAVVLNGEIHILGSGDSSNTTKHYKWDGASWTSVSTLPHVFHDGSAVVLNNEIHIIGGYNNRNHYKWDGTSWTKVSTPPYTPVYFSAVVYNNEIYILGGDSNTTSHYKFDGSSWISVSTLPYSFYAGSAVVFDNEIHILGSGDSSNTTKHYKWDGTSWTSVSTLPYDFTYGSVVVFDNGIHILGSNNSNYRTAHYLIYGYAPVYTFLDYIVSDKETAFPDGGEKGGYWYERVSNAKVASGTFTSTASKITIEHGLGVIPSKILVKIKNSVLTTGNYLMICASLENIIAAQRTSKGLKSYLLLESLSGNNTVKINCDENSFTIPYMFTNATTQVSLDGTFEWIAIAE